MEQFDWSPGGAELLLVIQLYIRENGGNLPLANKIIAEERAFRNGKQDPIRKKLGPRLIKKVRVWKGRVHRKFDSSILAAEFLETTVNNLQACIRYGCKSKGWNVDYYQREPHN